MSSTGIKVGLEGTGLGPSAESASFKRLLKYLKSIPTKLKVKAANQVKSKSDYQSFLKENKLLALFQTFESHLIR